jgi:hypothetical protein
MPHRQGGDPGGEIRRGDAPMPDAREADCTMTQIAQGSDYQQSKPVKSDETVRVGIQ